MVTIALTLIFKFELAGPGPVLWDDNIYIMVIADHGLIMIFFLIMPVLIGGFGNLFVPLLIGASGMAFPRLNSLSFWLLPPALILLLGSSLIEQWADTGWAFIPLSLGPQTYSGKSVSLVFFSLCTALASSIMGAINLIATIFYKRGPGMSFNKLPLFVWSVLIISFLLLLYLYVLAGAITVLIAIPLIW